MGQRGDVISAPHSRGSLERGSPAEPLGVGEGLLFEMNRLGNTTQDAQEVREQHVQRPSSRRERGEC